MGKTPKNGPPVSGETFGKPSLSTHNQLKKTTLEEKLEAFNPTIHGGESHFAELVGKEILKD